MSSPEDEPSSTVPDDTHDQPMEVDPPLTNGISLPEINVEASKVLNKPRITVKDLGQSEAGDKTNVDETEAGKVFSGQWLISEFYTKREKK